MAIPPPAGCLYVSDDRLFVPRLVVRTEYSTAEPFGAICGSETDLHRLEAVDVEGLLLRLLSCAASGDARAATARGE